MAYKIIGEYEIEPVRPADSCSVIVCKPAEAYFWSVYKRNPEGITTCIKEFKTEKEAIKYTKSLLK